MKRALFAGMAASLLAACSPDMERFAPGADITNSTRNANMLVPPGGIGGAPAVAAARAAPVRVGKVESAPLPAPSGDAIRPRFAAPATPSPRLAEAAVKSRDFPTGTARNLARSGNWSPVGGTPIVVARGENLSMIERRYGVPASTLLRVNGLKSAAQIKPGTRLTIPVYDASRKLTAKAKRSAPQKSSDTTASIRKPARPASRTAGAASSRPVARKVPSPVARPKTLARTTLSSGTRRPNASTRKQERDRLARLKAERAEKAAQARKLAARKKREELAAKKAADRRLAARKATARKAAASKSAIKTEPAKVAKTVAATRARADRAPVASIARSKPQRAPASASGNFRWPTRGRIIQGYRKGQNDGINIAVPEGTPVKAAEGGVVAYAGSELKGYGNLVLIRHPNGYVSAYAHNSQLKVKRGDRVRRGQTIAAAGRTGNVTTPQLHFELRKGASPVDPVKLLGSN